MKKTLLISDDFPPKIGGVANYYAQICKLLPLDKIAVLTIPAAAAYAFDQHQGYPVYRQRLLSRNPFLWPKWLTAVRVAGRYVRDQHFEKVFAGQILPYGSVAWVLWRRLGIPYIVAAHGMDIRIPRGRKRWMVWQILRNAERVIANSYATADYIEHLGIEKSKIVVITPAVNIPVTVKESELQNLRERYHVHEKRVVLTVSRLVPRKGHREVISALSSLLANIPACVYVIVGDGPEIGLLRQFVQVKKLQDSVIFTGALADTEVSAWYELCDVFVMTPTVDAEGDVEGFGTVYLEAASYGKPVVGSAMPGISEAVVHGVTGILVPPGNVAELKNALESILRNPGYAHRLGLQAHDRVLHEYTWKNRAGLIASVLGSYGCD